MAWRFLDCFLISPHQNTDNMRRILLLLCLLLAVSTMDAQNRKFYIDAVITPADNVNQGVDAFVDLGTGKDNTYGHLKVGDKVIFRSPMEIVNYFTGEGWTLTQIVEIGIGVGNAALMQALTGMSSEFDYPHYIFEKEAGSVDEAVAGIELVSLQEMKKYIKEQKKEKAKERAKTRTDDMYY